MIPDPLPRRRFAAAYRHPVWGIVLGAVGLFLIVVGLSQWSTDTGDVIWGGLIGLLLVVWAIYLLRGRGARPRRLPQPGPTQDELVWLDGVEYARARRERAQASVADGTLAGAAPGAGPGGRPDEGAEASIGVRASADPVATLEEAKRMLDAGLITSADYDAAKARALRL